ncbi:four helix bundle protein [Arcicella sp. DC2W]|uniref:Four helix bundle protein n=1 Tax=Arcicella gelida TaxID=2984195 RepID=A0ABU5S919_9BACT|nr:four helix bundle protein [Arcicella sp. DC2W]MEA5404968.1 four helix bundle protein [Arcicella sp. DC2W]
MLLHNFKELKVWKVSIDFVTKIYEKSASFPQYEMYGLTSQLRRAALSIPSNMAEGSGRGDKEFIRFLSISIASAFEVETQLIVAKNLKFTSESDLEILLIQIQEIQKMIHGLSRSLQAKIKKEKNEE